MARTVAETEEGFAVAVRVTTSGATAGVAVTVAVAVELAAVMATLLDGVAAGKKAVGTVAATGVEVTKEAVAPGEMARSVAKMGDEPAVAVTEVNSKGAERAAMAREAAAMEMGFVAVVRVATRVGELTASTTVDVEMGAKLVAVAMEAVAESLVAVVAAGTTVMD